MQKPSDPSPLPDDWEEHRRRVIGLGENSFRKSYYPEMRRSATNVKHLLLAIDQSPRGIFIAQRDGDIEYANQMLFTLSACSAEEIIGKPPRVLWKNVVEGASYRTLADQIDLGETWRTDLLIEDQDGQHRWVLMSVAPIHDELGDITHYLGSMEDISARKQAEEELRAIAQARQAALATAEHLSAMKSEFIANMSHELRTPIFQILGLARIGERNNDIERAKVHAAKIREAGERLTQIVESLLDFSAIESGKLQLVTGNFTVAELVDAVVAKWQERIREKGLTFCVDVQPDPQQVFYGDRRRLQQMVDELLGNAVKFTAEGQIRLAISDSASGLEINVADTGIGMTGDQVAHCLSAFVQADGSATRRFGGMGLGLALVKQLVELMRGKLDIDSAPGKGARFRINLPLPHSSGA